MRIILIFILFIGLNNSLYAENKNQNKTIDSLTINMKVSEGLINTYTDDENKLYFEILIICWEKNFSGHKVGSTTRKLRWISKRWI